nr:MAG TPA: hypothetical protein [Bacteriophage sp.]
MVYLHFKLKKVTTNHYIVFRRPCRLRHRRGFAK